MNPGSRPPLLTLVSYNRAKVGTQEYITMDSVKVGIREFREKLATYVLQSDTPVAITRHGDTVGYFIPARRERTDEDRAALKKAAAQLDALLAARGISEEEVFADFKRWRAGDRG